MSGKMPTYGFDSQYLSGKMPATWFSFSIFVWKDASYRFSLSISRLFLCWICMPMWPMPNISVAISMHAAFPYMQKMKNEITGRVAPASGMPKKLL